MKIALVYDRVNKWGGAERILLLLHEMFPDAPVYTSVYDPEAAPWAKELDIRTSFIQKIPIARPHHEFFALLMPMAFESFDLSKFDLVISLTSEAAKGIITKPGTKHICICLTPTRYLWSEYETYFPNSIVRFFLFPLLSYLRSWDKAAAQKPDLMIAISKTVQGRIKKYYGRESSIVYPPLFLNHEARSKKQENTGDKDYFLVVSRLSRFTPHKRVEMAIKAANRLGLKLKIIGGGDTAYFKKMAGKTVKIVGAVTDQRLANYYNNCTALIFPGVEDFGLVMIEAQSYGKPVIAYKAGGATEIVKEGKTGEFFENPTVSSLVKTLKSFNRSKYNSRYCISNAGRFSKKEFVHKLNMIIKEEKSL